MNFKIILILFLIFWIDLGSSLPNHSTIKEHFRVVTKNLIEYASEIQINLEECIYFVLFSLLLSSFIVTGKH